MPEFVVPAEGRTDTGKNANRKLRSRGLIPGVLYATGKPAQPVQVSPGEIGTILKSAAGENTIFDLDIAGKRRKVILREFQREPLRGKLLHADFYEVALDKKLQVKVHIELEGTPVGVKLQGGIVDFVTRELEIECLPADIPEKFVVDISHLELGKHLRVSDLKISDKIEVLTDPGVVVVHVVLPRAEVVEERRRPSRARPRRAPLRRSPRSSRRARPTRSRARPTRPKPEKPEKGEKREKK